jgi:hypothetical protein
MKVTELRKVIREEAVKSLARKAANEDIKRDAIRGLIREAYQDIVRESNANAPKIQAALEELRLTFLPEMLVRVDENGAGQHVPLEKRVQLKTVANLIGVQVNELMLYFINEVKTTNSRQLVEYHLGFCYFYAN